MGRETSVVLEYSQGARMSSRRLCRELRMNMLLVNRHWSKESHLESIDEDCWNKRYAMILFGREIWQGRLCRVGLR